MIDRAAMGAAAKRASKEQERRYFAWLRETGLFPDAERTTGGSDGKGGVGDGKNVGPRIIEVKAGYRTGLPAALVQAEGDMRLCGLAEYFVWAHIKKGDHEPGTVARSVLVGRAEVVWPLLAELDELRKAARR